MGKLDGKVAVITGGSSGMALAVLDVAGGLLPFELRRRVLGYVARIAVAQQHRSSQTHNLKRFSIRGSRW